MSGGGLTLMMMTVSTIKVRVSELLGTESGGELR
jgi:hypothetical protein